MEKVYKNNVLLIIALLFVSAIKLVLVSDQRVFAIANAIHDDRLFVGLATKLLKGAWLGKYNNVALAKGPLYPIFLALTYNLGLPLLLCQQLLYIGSGLILVMALKRLVKNNGLLFMLYCIYLFNPMTFNSAMLRVLREGIYPALTVLVLACAIGMLACHTERSRSFRRWSISLGFALSAFWLTREEGVWILPGLGLLLGGILLSWYRQYRLSSAFWRRSLVCVLPLVMLFLSLQAISLVNKRFYGVYTVVEFKSPGFLAAYGALSRVQPPHWQRYVPVPKEARALIYQVSPAFAELRPYLEGDLGKEWARHGWHLAEGDLGGGWFMWALRDAVALAGHCASGGAADQYYRRLAREVNQACDQGLLPCLPARKTMRPPWRPEYLRLWAASGKRAITFLITFEKFEGRPIPSIGDESSLNLFRRVTHNKLTDSTPDQEGEENGTRTLAPPSPGQVSRLQLRESIAYLYQKTVPFLFYVSLVYAIISLFPVFLRKSPYLILVNFAFLAAIMTRLLLISFIDATSFHAVNVLYLAPVYPLLLIFISLSIISMLQNIYALYVSFGSRAPGV